MNTPSRRHRHRQMSASLTRRTYFSLYAHRAMNPLKFTLDGIAKSFIGCPEIASTTTSSLIVQCDVVSAPQEAGQPNLQKSADVVHPATSWRAGSCGKQFCHRNLW